MSRARLKPALRVAREGGGQYFAAPSSALTFISSGCALLDCVLGGGWPLGRVSNIVGDKSTGKTLLAIEAAANCAQSFPKARIRYVEAEAAFDKPYAAALGLPLDRIDFPDEDRPILTVEDLFEDLQAFTAKTNGHPALYIIDSLDALSDREETDRKIDKGTYGAQKAKKMGELFRRLVKPLERTKVHVMVISQVRDKIGVTFGERYSRSGGHALDFYASQALWLAQTKKFKKTMQGIDRVTGVQVLAKTKKNKVSLPHRECYIDLLFGFGVDDLSTNLAWLLEVKHIDRMDLPASAASLKNYMERLSNEEYIAACKRSDEVVRQVWSEIETGFLPKRRKYA